MTRSTESFKKKMMVTGYGGFVAGSVIAQARGDWEIHGVGRSEPPPDTEFEKYHVLDLLDSEHVGRLFHAIDPDVVVHAAALANIDYCEKHQHIAEATNVQTTKVLVELCKNSGAKLIFCSTDNVFDGEMGLYSEENLPNAINFYAETKIRSEQAVQSMEDSWVIARLALVLGFPQIGRGNSYLSAMVERLKNGEHEKAPENEIRTPIDVITLGKALIELGGNDYSGIMHLAGNSRLNRYEMARIIAEKMNLVSDLLITTNSNLIPDRAPRPEDVSLENTLARGILKTPMLSLLKGLDLTLNFSAGRTS